MVILCDCSAARREQAMQCVIDFAAGQMSMATEKARRLEGLLREKEELELSLRRVGAHKVTAPPLVLSGHAASLTPY